MHLSPVAPMDLSDVAASQAERCLWHAENKRSIGVLPGEEDCSTNEAHVLSIQSSSRSQESSPPSHAAFASEASSSTSTTCVSNCFNEESSDIAEATLALFHNAFLREVALYRSFTRPLLKPNSFFDDLEEFSDALLHRWDELKPFLVLVSNMERLVCSSVFWTVHTSRPHYSSVRFAHERVEERIKVGLELYVAIIERQRGAVFTEPSMQCLKTFAESTENFLRFLEATAQGCWDLINCADHAGHRSSYSSFENRIWDELQCTIRLEDFGDTADSLLFWRDKPYRYLSGSRRPTDIMGKVRQWVKEYTERRKQENSSFSFSSSSSSAISSVGNA